MLPSRSRLKTSTSLIFISLKIPEQAILLNSFPMLKFLLTLDMLRILFSSLVMLSQCFLLFRSWLPHKLCTISTLGILPKSREPKLESRTPFLHSLLALARLSCLSSLKFTLICWPEKSKSMELTFGLSTPGGPVENTASARYSKVLIQRISIQATRNIINAIHDGSLANAEYKTLPIFNLQYPSSLPGVDAKILNPRDSWSNPSEYDDSLAKVASMFK